ncbi:hypothetical protein [Glycomyces buryatensis]|uniref:Nuclear transport factor 2 family protein n=1 Tax=Glycomyces buryatensis TaxID=2570927 RepID=A0A4S8PVY7_9ACTN|nr:hypothetical protein [Glycomyces buryatensis]THV35688.1 hypothetical protein FAB82_22700 [Glycomyces buryatensis]
MGRRLLISIAFGLMTAVAAACTGPGDPGDNTTDSLPSQAESSTADESEPTPDEAAEAAVEAYWKAVDEAAAIPDPDYDALQEVATGQALQAAQDIAQSMVDQDQKQNGLAVISDTTVLERTPEEDPTTILIELCMDTSTAVIVDAGTEVPVEGEEYGRRGSRAEVLKSADGWVVDVVNVQELGSC